VLLLAGCSVTTTVSVHVDEDGAGVVGVKVALDAAAVGAADAGGGQLEDRVRLGDLEAAGWKVGTWERAQDGSATIVLRKKFASVDRIPGIIGEINGTDGPLRDVHVLHHRGLLGTDYRVSGRIDLKDAATGIAGDPALAQALTANRVDVAALDQYLRGVVRESIHVALLVRLPGGVVEHAKASGDEDVAWSASSSVRNTRRLVLLVVVGALVILAVTLWFSGRPHRQPAPEGD
jgi:hypothetical protein